MSGKSARPKKQKNTSTSGKSVTAIPYFDSLSVECLAKVFVHVPVIERLKIREVCIKWKNAVELSWSEVKKVELVQEWEGQPVTYSMIKTVLTHCGRYLEHLIITSSAALKSKLNILPLVTMNCHNLRKLEIFVTFNGIKDGYLVGAFNKMKRLKSLVIVDASQKSDKVIPGIQNLIFRSLPEELEEVFITALNQKIVMSRKYPFSLEKFKCLNYLALFCWEFNYNAIKEISQKTTLTEVLFEGCTIKEGASLLGNLTNLEKITLEDADEMDGSLIASIGKNCRKLKHFQVNRCPNTSAEDLMELANCEELECITLSRMENINDEVMMEITRSCKKLEVIEFSRPDKIFEYEFKCVVNCKNLKILSLDRVDKIDSNFLLKLRINCPKLRRLDLNYCEDLTKLALVELAKFVNLEELYLETTFDVDDKVLANMKKLKILDITGLVEVTDAGVMKVLGNCPDLEVLKISHCKITKKSLIFADRKLKERTNNTPLTILAVDDVIDDFKKMVKHPSPLLTLQCASEHPCSPVALQRIMSYTTFNAMFGNMENFGQMFFPGFMHQ